MIMRAVAVLFAIISAWFLYIGFSMDTTITSEGMDVVNMQLMHIQSLNIALGVGAGIAAVLIAVGGAVVDAIERASGALSRPGNPVPSGD